MTDQNKERDSKHGAKDAHDDDWGRLLDDVEQSFEAEAEGARKSPFADLPPIPTVEQALFDGPAPPPEALNDDLPSTDPYGAARRLMSLDEDELDSMTLQELALAQSYLEAMPRKGSDARTQRVLGQRLRKANQKPPATDSERKAADERRRQRLLRDTVNKVQSDSVDELTVQELDLITNSYTLLSKKIARVDGDDRLLNLLHSSMDNLEEKCADLKAKLEAHRKKRGK